jgi:4-amino-4-deoxy-L-arabinose transferase-like glycosyltransferase
LAYGLLGSRGIWDKPPLTYWEIAAGVDLFGRNPGAARLPVAIAYLLSVALTWQLARRLAPGSEVVAALAFATCIVSVRGEAVGPTHPPIGELIHE